MTDSTVERPAASDDPARREGDALLSWLSLFGWSVELDPAEDRITGTARRVVGGVEVVLRARATSRTEVVWKLFQRALATVDNTTRAGDQASPPLAAVA